MLSLIINTCILLYKCADMLRYETRVGYINILIYANAWDDMTLHATDMSIFGQVELDRKCIGKIFAPRPGRLSFILETAICPEKDGYGSSVLYKELWCHNAIKSILDETTRLCSVNSTCVKTYEFVYLYIRHIAKKNTADFYRIPMLNATFTNKQGYLR